MSLKDPLNTDERDWSAPTHGEHTARLCHECCTVLIPREARYFAGWPYCEQHYQEIVTLSMTPEQRELERASRADIERDDFNRVRR